MAFVSSFCGAAVAAPARGLVSSHRVSRVHVRGARNARMSMGPVVDQTIARMAEASSLLAVKDGDFGGYTGPVVGLLIIGIIIAVLTPPVKE